MLFFSQRLLIIVVFKYIYLCCFLCLFHSHSFSLFNSLGFIGLLHPSILHGYDQRLIRMSRYDRRRTQHKASPPSCSSGEDDLDESRNSDRHRRRRPYFSTKWEPSFERSQTHHQNDGNRPSRHSLDPYDNISRKEKDRVSYYGGGKGIRERSKLDDHDDDDGRRNRRHRYRHGDHHARRKFDVVDDQDHIKSNGYLRE